MNNDNEKLIDNDARLVGKKPSAWPWLLGLLVLLVLAWFVWSRSKNHKESVDNLTTNNSTVTTNNQTILTDFNSVYQIQDINDLNNRPFEISNLLVTKVLSDKVFTVSTAANNPIQLYVLLPDSLDNGGAENKVVVKQGQHLNIKGTFHKNPDDINGIAQKYSLTPPQMADLKNRLIYAEAQSVTEVK